MAEVEEEEGDFLVATSVVTDNPGLYNSLDELVSFLIQSLFVVIATLSLICYLTQSAGNCLLLARGC